MKLSELMVSQSRIKVKFTAFYVASKTCGAAGRDRKCVFFKFIRKEQVELNLSEFIPSNSSLRKESNSSMRKERLKEQL